MECPTIKVKDASADNPTGYMVINAEDFVEGVHEKYEPAPDSAAEQAEAEPKKAKK